MTLLFACLRLFFTFFKIGIFGFGGGYTMLSMILAESERLSITMEQFADLTALDMIVPGPIAINAATYVGYLHAGFWGSLAATIGVSLPSFLIVTLAMHLLRKYKENNLLGDFLSGVKPAAVGLIAAAALLIASDVLLQPGAALRTIFTDPVGTVSFLMVAIFLAAAISNIRFKINPILLTIFAGVLGAVFAA